MADSSSPWDLFQDLLPREQVDALDPRAPQAVYTPFVVLWLLIFQRLNQNASLAEAVGELLHRFPVAALPTQQADRISDLSAATGAYSAARSALAGDVLAWAARRSFDALLPCYPPSFKGLRGILLDGTSLTLAPLASLKGDFPPASNQHGESPWPVLRLLVAHDLDSGLAAASAHGPMYGPAAVSEQALVLDLLPLLPANSILLADRNFGVFSVAWATAQAGHGLLTRLTEARWKALVRGAAAGGPGGGRRVVWRPSKADRRADPSLPADAAVAGWLHEADIGGGRMLRLFTTVEMTGEEAAAYYKRRGEVETDIRDLKVTLGLGKVSGRSKKMVEKELAAATVAYNLANQVRRLAAAAAGVPPRRLSFAGTWALVKAFLGSLAGLSGEEAEAGFQRLLRQAGQRKLPRRKEGRSHPREAYRRRREYLPKKPPGKPASA